MDVAALSMGLSHTSLRQDASLSIMKKTMDQAENNSNGMMKMMQQSVQPHLGKSVDIQG